MWSEDNRTVEERRRAIELCERRRANDLLAFGFLKSCVRPLLKNHGVDDIGLVSEGAFSGAELLVEVDGVTYKLTARVDHDE